MSRQDKATTERNARILRDLVKQPDNKACADCRKNDARWASWNLGVYLCIRCSGIHRSMGTHISKVKSIDLDIWTPEQMESIQKWGNRRANLYWEKHLKAGHVPPDHKIESFIRSKYESRRWAMEGPQPRDPSVLDGGASGEGTGQPINDAPRPTPTSTAPAAAPAPKTHHPLLSRTAKPAPSARAAPPQPSAVAPIVDLFGSDEPPSLAPPVQTTDAPPQYTPAPQTQGATTGANAPAPTAAPAPAPAQGSSIFDLDFRTPTPSSATNNGAKPQTAKADIMSLFSSAPPNSAPPQASGGTAGGGFFGAPSPPAIVQQNPYASWGGGITSSAPQQASQFGHQPTQAPVPVGGGGGWGGMQDQNVWGSSSNSNSNANSTSQGYHQQAQQSHQSQAYAQPQAQVQSSNSNLWGNTNTSSQPPQDPWAAPSSNTNAGFFGAGSNVAPVQAQAQKKDDRDPFANIWG